MGTVGALAPAYFVGRREIMCWVNATLELELSKIEETSTGAVACQLTDALFPGIVPMAKVNFSARTEYDKLQNYKILQAAWRKKKIDKPIDVNKLVRGKAQDNLEFMQWFKAFYESRHPVDGYDPVAARAAPLPSLAKKTPAAATAPSARARTTGTSTRHNMTSSAAAAAKKSRSVGARHGANKPPPPPRTTIARTATSASAARIQQLELEVEDLRQEADAIEGERDFYFNKLRDIERHLEQRDQAASAEDLAKHLFDILYESARTGEDSLTAASCLSSVPEEVPLQSPQEDRGGPIHAEDRTVEA